MAAKQGECDIAGIHLMDPTGIYNRSYVDETLRLVGMAGIARMQGVVVNQRDNPRFAGLDAGMAPLPLRRSLDPTCLMANRNAGSGTRIPPDRPCLLGDARPAGYSHQCSAARMPWRWPSCSSVPIGA